MNRVLRGVAHGVALVEAGGRVGQQDAVGGKRKVVGSGVEEDVVGDF